MSRHTGAGPTSVSTTASGRAPIAARSLMLATMAPAPYGSRATKAGSMASPPTTSVRPSSSTTAPSSPGPAHQSPPASTSATVPMALFERTPGRSRIRRARPSSSPGGRSDDGAGTGAMYHRAARRPPGAGTGAGVAHPRFPGAPGPDGEAQDVRAAARAGRRHVGGRGPPAPGGGRSADRHLEVRLGHGLHRSEPRGKAR